jgi:hypothetical protein
MKEQMKLKGTEIYNTEDVPDHIIQEIIALSMKMGNDVYDKHLHSAPPNIILGALNWVVASVTNELVAENDAAMEKAARQQAKAIYGNIMHCYNIRKKMKEEK